jgi:hypothetical protein
MPLFIALKFNKSMGVGRKKIRLINNKTMLAKK